MSINVISAFEQHVMTVVNGPTRLEVRFRPKPALLMRLSVECDRRFRAGIRLILSLTAVANSEMWV